jgi:asparagine synthetase A
MQNVKVLIILVKYDCDCKLFKLSKIEHVLEDMEKGVCSKELLDEYPDLMAKSQENEKLKYRLNLLKRVSAGSMALC